MNQPAQKFQPISTDVIRRLWGHLSDQFNVEVYSISTGLDANKQRVASVLVDSKHEPIIQTLPQTFEGENVVYRPGQQPQFS